VPQLTLDGAPLVSDVDYLASVDAAASQVWIALLRGRAGSHTIDGSANLHETVCLGWGGTGIVFAWRVRTQRS
jgi:CHASE2 domain-containing sensor protein